VYQGIDARELYELDILFPQKCSNDSHVVLLPLKDGETLGEVSRMFDNWKWQYPTLEPCTAEEVVEIRKQGIELSEYTLVALGSMALRDSTFQHFQLPGEGNTIQESCFTPSDTKRTTFEIVIPFKV
jgi:hypothetical protein